MFARPAIVSLPGVSYSIYLDLWLEFVVILSPMQVQVVWQGLFWVEIDSVLEFWQLAADIPAVEQVIAMDMLGRIQGVLGSLFYGFANTSHN